MHDCEIVAEPQSHMSDKMIGCVKMSAEFLVFDREPSNRSSWNVVVVTLASAPRQLPYAVEISSAIAFLASW